MSEEKFDFGALLDAQFKGMDSQRTLRQGGS